MDAAQQKHREILSYFRDHDMSIVEISQMHGLAECYIEEIIRTALNKKTSSNPHTEERSSSLGAPSDSGDYSRAYFLGLLVWSLLLNLILLIYEIAECPGVNP